MSKRSDAAADRFLRLLVPGANPHFPSDRARTAQKLVRSAFRLYETEWGPNYNVGQWTWPFDELQSGAEFAGDEPWTVLFRHASLLTRCQSQSLTS